MQGINTINAIAKGNNPSQQKVANWSNLNLGKVALNHTKIKQNMQVFIPIIIDSILNNCPVDTAHSKLDKLSKPSFKKKSGKL